MPVIVIDIKRDRTGDAMKHMLDDGAFPDRLSGMLKEILPDVFPMKESPCMREMWPGQGFPVSDPIHAILNYLYATSQRPVIPGDVMGSMRKEVQDVMEVDGGFDEGIKKEILSGSTKVYNRVLDDGTEIKVEVTRPVQKDAFADLDSRIEGIAQRKTAEADRAYNTARVDLDKLGILLNKVAMYHPEKGLTAELDAVCRKAAVAVTIPVRGNDPWLSVIVRKIAEVTGEGEEEIVKEVLADKKSDDKVVVHGCLFDKSKFKAYPFDSKANAVKAVGKQAADLICSETGNIDPDKLKMLEEYAEDDPVIGRVIDRLVPYVGWKGNLPLGLPRGF